MIWSGWRSPPFIILLIVVSALAVWPASIASVKSRRHVSGVAEERLDIARREAEALAERRVQHRDDPVEASHVVAEPLGNPCRRAHVEPHAVQLGLAPHPSGAVARFAGRVGISHVPAGGGHRIRQLLGESASAGHEHELRRVEGIGEIAEQRAELLGGKAPDVTSDDDPAVCEEGQRLGGVHDQPQLVVLTVELVDEQAAVVVADEMRDEIVGLVAQDRVVVTGQQMDTHGNAILTAGPGGRRT